MNNVCFIESFSNISFATFYENITLVRNRIRATEFQDVLLSNRDCYQFSVYLFALLLEKRHVLLPQNGQKGTLAQLANLCDATLGDISLTTKPSIDIRSLDITHNGSDFSVKPSDSPLSRAELFANLDGQITFFTSGSIGQPKAVKKHFKQLIAEINVLLDTFAAIFEHADGVLSTVSHQHIYGLLFKVLLPIRAGISIVNNTFEYPEHIKNYLSEGKQQSGFDKFVLISSPAHLSRLVIDNVLVSTKEKLCGVFSSGGPLSFEISQLFNQQMHIVPTEIFGSTETGGIAWRRQNRESQFWKIFPCISFNASFPERKLVINSPFISEQHFISDDLIEPIDESHFVLLGRADRVIKLEEKKLNLTHVEQYLCAHPWVVNATVLPLKQNTRNVLGTVLEVTDEAHKVIETKSKRSLNELFKLHLLDEFERVCLPKKWRYVKRFPYNTQGKIILTELENLFD